MSAQAKVPFNRDHVERCLCAKCPVQAKSQCVDEKKSGLARVMAHNPLSPADIPGEYCSTGTATCGDLDGSQQCSCFDCPVYEQYSLAEGWPTCYYCMNGLAQ
ncbi:MAG: DUF2769 domain-containing protein [Chloroflexi bacterium]|nr:DUF2769 domain-containing protein [Chloroflexota bacterium]